MENKVLGYPVRDVILQKAFKQLNRFMLFLWRLDLSWMVNIWPEGSGRIMVLTHKGRKSGQTRRTPVNYTILDGEVYCCAGFGKISDWYRNVMANPHVEIWLPDGTWQEGIAEDISDSPQRLAILREVIIASGFAGPLFGVDARKLSDIELEQLTGNYCLLHIARGQARTGPGGPGDLAWIWPVATMLMLPIVFRKKGRR